MTPSLFTPEIKDFISKNNYGKSLIEITQLINDTFHTSYSTNQISAYRKNHHLISGIDTRFKKGNVPPLKGCKGQYAMGCQKTWFKKGNRPHNIAKVGDETINTQGYWKVKIAEPNVWRNKHLIVWESVNGKIPEGCVIIFKDGNKNNLDISNLCCISKRENLQLNRRKLHSTSPEVTMIGVNVAKLIVKIADVKRGQND